MPNKNTKSKLHPRSKHRGQYDFDKLTQALPGLEHFVQLNKYQNKSIDFFDPLAVKMLNSALLKYFYGVESWSIPKGYLCPPIPGRADYLHYVADLLARKNNKKIPEGPSVKVLDIGVGASCIYPIIGAKEYGWSFVGADIDAKAIQSAKENVQNNHFPKGQIILRNQSRKHKFFDDIIRDDEFFDISICNPPFHSSSAEASKSTQRKLKNLKGNKAQDLVRNFGGNNQELWCEGGELRFIKDMVNQSKYFAKSVYWFTTLVSKKTNVRIIYKALQKINVAEIVVIEMGQGNKQSRVIAWRFY